uniref:Uncharacterized protein n=1 Tax=Zea mays TaxID=4577 RepID=C0PGL6_MAIZE|nr:unknown [Zea mays]
MVASRHALAARAGAGAGTAGRLASRWVAVLRNNWRSAEGEGTKHEGGGGGGGTTGERPLLPTRAMTLPAGMDNENPWRIGLSWREGYAKCTLRNLISP